MTTIIGVIAILLAVYALASGSGIFAERSGTINLSIEGGMIMGALGYVMSTRLLVDLSGYEMSWWIALVGILTSIVFGIIITSFLSFTAINLRGNQVVIGTAINIAAPVISLLTIVIITSGEFAVPTNDIQITTNLNDKIDTYVIQIIIAGIVLFIMLGLFILMRLTPLGLRLRAAGENPHALASTGVSVLKIKHIGMLFSGILAGLAGGIVVSAYSKFSSYTNTTLGMGFIALSILILGQWRMQFTILGSLVFAAMFATVDHFSVELGQNKFLLNLVPYTFTILVLPLISKWSKPPSANGVPYYNTGR